MAGPSRILAMPNEFMLRVIARKKMSAGAIYNYIRLQSKVLGYVKTIKTPEKP
jgi:hypothetical protein